MVTSDGTAEPSYRIVYGINPRILASRAMALLCEAKPEQSITELRGEYIAKAAVTAHSRIPGNTRGKKKQFEVVDEYLVACTPVINKTQKWPDFESFFNGSSNIKKGRNTRYELISSTGRVIYKSADARMRLKSRSLTRRFQEGGTEEN